MALAYYGPEASTPEVSAMVKTGFLTVVLGAVFLSCATSSKPPEAVEKPQPKPALATTAPEPEAAPRPAAAAVIRPKLAPGHCEESFDCVDTVGFPPSGYRWSCDNGKCGRAKLPSLGGEQQPAATDQDASAVASEPKTKSRKRHK
jgi:hypothetical protein